MRVDHTQRSNTGAAPIHVQIVYTIEVTEEYRRAINQRCDRAGLATRGEIRDWHIRYGTSLDQDLTAAQGH